MDLNDEIRETVTRGTKPRCGMLDEVILYEGINPGWIRGKHGLGELESGDVVGYVMSIQRRVKRWTM